MYKLSKQVRKIRNRTILAVLALVLVANLSDSSRVSDLDRVLNKGQLVMLTLPGATTYFEDGYGKNGF
jgi:hypothetical protein